MVQTNLIVGVRVRPLLESEVAKNDPARDILRVLDQRMVVVLDPDESKGYLDQLANRSKEKKYTFDYAFPTDASNRVIYEGAIKGLVSGVLEGLNGTVFAYGATGSGKTFTMVGTEKDPGLMVLSLEQIFREREQREAQEAVEVTCSYLEVYNEAIYDLLVKKSGPLELREDPSQGVQVAGLTRIRVDTAEQIMVLLQEGNTRRKTDSTSANEASSRSHAVLEISVRCLAPVHYKRNELRGKLCLVDLAGSERAAETNNMGQKLRDGANINRSLLALANCINALGKRKKQGMAYVPYRNSKLTRLLKDGLSGNSATAMIATVAASSDQYHHSINTLKYADRAKEIKTHVMPNVGTIESHISDYRRIIDTLQSEVQELKIRLEEKPSSASSVDDQLSWIDTLASEINENVEERINLQKALFELEDVNVCNKFELKNLEDYLSSGTRLSEEEENELRERRQDILENIKENEETGVRYRHDIDYNEQSRFQIQQRIEQGMEQYQNASFLKILSTFRLQAVRLQEFQFQMAIRDQIISEQRNVIKNLWNVMEYSGLDKDTFLEIAENEGIRMDQYLETAKRAPSVGASDLLTLLNTERRVQRTILQKQQQDQQAPGNGALNSPCHEASDSEHDGGAATSQSLPPKRETAGQRRESQSNTSALEERRKTDSGSYERRDRVWRHRGKKEEDTHDQRRSRSSDSNRKKEPLALRGSSFAASRMPPASQDQANQKAAGDRSPVIFVAEGEKGQKGHPKTASSQPGYTERERERRRVQINLLKSLSRRDMQNTSARSQAPKNRR